MNAEQQLAYTEAVSRIDIWIKHGDSYQPLDFSNIKNLNTLPPIPHGARHLNISYTDVDTLDELPPNLEELYCANSKLKHLPTLPKTLLTLVARGCPFTAAEMPELPSTIVHRVL
jgi:hypothetical protein